MGKSSRGWSGCAARAQPDQPPGKSLKVAAVSGIAPDSPRLQRGANLSQLHSHAVGRMGGKSVTPTGIAPTVPDWRSGILLLYDDLLMEIKTNSAASPMMDSHPQNDFAADLSVFQAHLLWQEP